MEAKIVICPKFKVGDKVRLVKPTVYHNAGQFEEGDVAIVTKVKEDFFVRKPGYFLSDHRDIFFEDELELYPKNIVTIKMVVDVNDPKRAIKEAKRCVKRIIEIERQVKEEAERLKRDWTAEELASVRECFNNLIVMWFHENDDAHFAVRPRERAVYLVSNAKVMGKSVCTGNDIFNEEVGKLIALLHALDLPVPDFIKNKNREEKR